MNTATKQELIGKLGRLCELSPGVRVGQLIDHLGFLSQDMFDRSLSDVEDEQLLKVLDRHEAELKQRETNAA